MRKILLIAFLIAVLTVGAVSASQNSTDLAVNEIQGDDIKICESPNEIMEIDNQNELNDTVEIDIRDSYVDSPYESSKIKITSEREMNMSVYYDDVYHSTEKIKKDVNYIEIPLKNLEVGQHTFKGIFTDNATNITKICPFNVTSFTIFESYDYAMDKLLVPEYEIQGGDGYITVLVNGKQYEKALLINGNKIVRFDNLVKGENLCEFIYEGDSNYPAQYRKMVLNAGGDIRDYRVDTYSRNGYYYVVLTLNYDATGNVTLQLHNDTYVSGCYGGAIFKIMPSKEDIKGGMAICTLSYSGDEKYSAFSTGAELYFTYYDPEFPFEMPYEIDYGSQPVISLNLPENANGDFIVNLDGIDYIAHITNGSANVTLPVQFRYNFTAKYNGTDYAAKNGTYTIKVNNYYNITAPKEKIMGTPANVTVEVPKELTSQISITNSNDGRSINATLTDGKATLPLPELEYGSWLFKVKYLDDKNQWTDLSKFSVNYRHNITAPSRLYLKEKANVTIQLPQQYTGKITLFIDYEEIAEGCLESGMLAFELPDNLTLGFHRIDIQYYNESASYLIEDLCIADLEIAMKKNMNNYSDWQTNKEYVLYLPEDANGTLIMKNNGEIMAQTTAKDGIAGVTLPTKDGEYDLEFKYEDERYGSFYDHYSYMVYKPIERAYDSAEGLVIVASKGIGGSLMINYGTDVYFCHITDGKSLLPEVHLVDDIDITYGGNKDFLSFAVESIAVEEASPSDCGLNITADDILLGQNFTLFIECSKELSGEMGVLINGTNYTVNVINGNGNLTVNDLALGKYDVSVKFEGNKYFNATEKTASFEVLDPRLSSEISAPEITATYNANKNLIITLKDQNAQPISNAQIIVTINGNAKVLKTDSSGQAKLSADNLVPKSYPVSITYVGDDKYLGSSVNSKVTVKKATPKIAASKKTYKVKTKTKKYVITLKTDKNKAMKYKKVYLKVKGKTYTAKTNGNGKATFKITKLTKKGTFKATITFKGDSCYNKKVVSKKIAVKK